LAKSYDWLHDLKLSKEYANFLATRNLLPESTWANYKLLGIQGLVETDMLNVCSAELRKRWRRNRPIIFNRDAKNESN